MSYIGNKPFTEAERKVQDHATTASKTIYPVSGGYTPGFIDVILNGVTLQSSDYMATDGLNVQLVVATQSGDTLTTVAWGTFVAANVVQPNDPRLATAWCTFNGNTGAIISSYNIASVTRTAAGTYDIVYETPLSSGQTVIHCTPEGGEVGYPATTPAPSTTGFKLFVVNQTGTTVDRAVVGISVIGGNA